MAIPKTARNMAEAAGLYLAATIDGITEVRRIDDEYARAKYPEHESVYLRFNDGSVYAVSIAKQSTSTDTAIAAESR